MLSLWRAHGLDRILRIARQRGAILSGVSAGMVCWFEACLSDSFGAPEPLHDGLGLIAGSACPHYDGELTRRPRYQQAIASGLPGGYGVDDGAALHFVGDKLTEVISSRPTAAAYRVHTSGAGVSEERLPARFLGA